MSKPIIFTDKIDITYNLGKQNEFKANKGTTLELFAEEYIILFGPSGCGKSTLLYSMFGVLPPSAGKIYVKGQSIYDFTPAEMVNFQRKTMGIMYQSFNLINSITVLDNVSLPLIFAGMPSYVREKRAMELLKRFAIDHVAHKRPTLLSGGQQQRVSAARSLVNDPEILIADEPVGNLDSISAQQVMDTLETINSRDRKTVLLVTHDAKYLPYAHRVVHLKDGKLMGITANPEKKQIKKIVPGETIITELEQISRIYPYISPGEVRVKSIVNYLTQGLSFDQLSHLEKIVEEVMEGKISDQMMFDIMIAEQAEHGLGLTENVAKDIASKMRKIVFQSTDIARLRAMKQRGTPITSQDEHIKRIQRYILNEYDLNVTEEQSMVLGEAIEQRVLGFIKKEDFKEVLSAPLSEKGVGLDTKTMHMTARYLEKLLAQGVAAGSIKTGE
ncbi:MAG: ABC transporter ATP-binding protein [Candidatus Paceibacterota bacterium]|jgi:putative ABC transport system ATP-binding protein|nr:ABC transporter ATP-binding protein [Candidatus Paceibacterota bacterium]